MELRDKVEFEYFMHYEMNIAMGFVICISLLDNASLVEASRLIDFFGSAKCSAHEKVIIPMVLAGEIKCDLQHEPSSSLQ